MDLIEILVVAVRSSINFYNNFRVYILENAIEG